MAEKGGFLLMQPRADRLFHDEKGRQGSIRKLL